jgi:riboflavin synthase
MLKLTCLYSFSMKITFVAYKENPVNFFKELAGKLSKKISGLELAERFVPALEDVPEVAQEATEESDFIFVFVVSDDEEERRMLEHKLIDVELKTSVRILKAVVDDEFSDLGEEEYAMEKDETVERYVEMIVSILFNEEEFEPQDKDFSI